MSDGDSIRVLNKGPHERLLVIPGQISLELPDILGGYAKRIVPLAPILEQPCRMFMNPRVSGISRVVLHPGGSPPRMFRKDGHHCLPSVTEGKKIPFLHNSARSPSLDEYF